MGVERRSALLAVPYAHCGCMLGPCCPEFNSGGRTRTGFGVGVRPEVGLAQVRTFAKLLVTHGFRLKGPLFADSEYGLGSGSGYGLEDGGVGRER